MKSIVTALVFSFAAIFAVHAAPRIAVVRVTDIYAAMPGTANIAKDSEEESKKILTDPRAEDVRKIISEMQGLFDRLSDKKSPPSEEQTRELARTYELKRLQARTLQTEFETFRTTRQKEIDRVMIKRMRDALNQIWEITRKIAKERGYDVVLDSTGKTNTNLPFVLYAKNPEDITDIVVAALKDATAPTP